MDGESQFHAFHTQKGYEQASGNGLTAAMEDYLEMICRLSGEEGYTRINALARSLNVKPSSASKMVENLRSQGLVRAEKYGCITLTDGGRSAGDYLLYRHDLLNRFLCHINHSDDELEQVEKIEHYIDEHTVRNIARFLSELAQPPDA